MLVQKVYECKRAGCANEYSARTVTLTEGPRAGETVQLAPLRFARVLDDGSGVWAIDGKTDACPACGKPMEEVA